MDFCKMCVFGLSAVCNFSFEVMLVRKSESDVGQHLKDLFFRKVKVVVLT